MKNWPFFAIILPWMARYGSETSFLLIFSARDDLVKVSWKSDARKCQNQLTPHYFDQLSERYQPLWNLPQSWCGKEAIVLQQVSRLLSFFHPFEFWIDQICWQLNREVLTLVLRQEWYYLCLQTNTPRNIIIDLVLRSLGSCITAQHGRICAFSISYPIPLLLRIERLW